MARRSSRRLMSKGIGLFLFLGLALVLMGCGPSLQRVAVSEEVVKAERDKQRELAFSAFVKRQERLMGVSYPLLTAAGELCKRDAQPIYGLMLHDKELYRKMLGKEYEGVASRYYGLGKRVTVRYVHPDFPAGRAGLKVGDPILAINGKALGDKSALEAMDIIDKLDLPEGRPLLLGIEREGKTLDLSIQGVPGCKYAAYLVNSDDVNASADGSRVVVTTGMVRFVETDDELALVVSHEIAHNALGHMRKREINVLFGSLLDSLIYGATGVDTGWVFAQLGGRAFSQAFEAEADYAGLYISARAGRNITDAANFWRRLAIEHPASIKQSFSSTHPSAPERFTAIEKAVQEIDEKRKRGEPLLPSRPSP